jgi:DNA-binding HxlR family transcriptional regulator
VPCEWSCGLPKDSHPDPAVLAAIAALDREMDRHGKGRDDPIRALCGYVGDRWSTLILLVLQTGEWRHGALRRVLAEVSDEGAISQRVLTLKLRGLERDGLVHRVSTDEVPPKVSYQLTADGQSFVKQVRGLIDWIAAHEQMISNARQTFDRTKPR